ncbi:hypothetical protein SBOR_2989 [Sclerotinia borealis F-4128]|uniref:Uncharacterized protein n=1 Tax=Sclerotinia borealis (strain F-4128) TaxID=1432307 RepID=W9CIN2_SCLBF|nr:hypothetical protein SBOR_2989 [Sclerotinia borealis F-4128]
MDDFVDISGIDMNNNSNLSIYIQLITFRKGSVEEISIDVPEDCQVETARCLSRRLNFRCRYEYDTRKAIITRNSSLHSLELPDLNDFEVDMQGSFYDDYIDTGDTDMDMEVSTYQNVTTPLPESFGDFEASEHNIGFSNELFADMPMNLDDAIFGDLINGLQSENDDGDTLPDWSDLVNIADQHGFDLDANMLEITQLDDDGFDDEPSSCETVQLAIDTPITTVAHNLINEMTSWTESPLAPVAVFDVPTPRPLSRAESIKSMPAGHSQSQIIDILVKPSLNRSESSFSNTPSSYQEGVFSSTPGLSSVPTTYGSSPRRMGPLDAVTRAKANSVKAIGACWRCKFLRKPCDAQTCCSQCRGKQGGPWHSIGCKRSDIKNKMLPISLCPKKIVGSSHSSAIADDYRPWINANHSYLEILEQRENYLVHGIMSASSPTKVDKFLQDLETGKPLLVGLQRTRLPLLGRPNKSALAVLKPLDDCILTILWGLLECESAQEAIRSWMNLHNGTLGDFIILLNSAAVYQASVRSNQLIAYSLTCLRSCIEALHDNASGGLGDSHEACELFICKVDCVRNIELQLEQYLDELSRVTFLKENMRSRIWWLSTFYSFCIQGVIRQALILLSSNGQNEVSKSEELGSAQYLYIAIRLFTVSSGNHDPLIRDWSSEFAFSSLDDEAPRIEDYQNAQSAIKQSDWRLKGIKKSGNYLKNLFEDNGGTLTETENEYPNFRILPEPYLPETFTLETCRQLRADWDLARCNYTKDIVHVVKHHGHDSKAYTDAEGKWTFVEAEWKRFSDETISNTVTNVHNGCATPRSSTDSHASPQNVDLPCRPKKNINYACKPPSSTPASTSKPLRLDSLFTFIIPYLPSLLPPLPRPSSPPPSESSHLTPEPPNRNRNLYYPYYIRHPPFQISPSDLDPVAQEGYCGYCIPGRWLSLDGPYQDDKDFKHGSLRLRGEKSRGLGVLGR